MKAAMRIVGWLSTHESICAKLTLIVKKLMTIICSLTRTSLEIIPSEVEVAPHPQDN